MLHLHYYNVWFAALRFQRAVYAPGILAINNSVCERWKNTMHSELNLQCECSFLQTELILFTMVNQ